MDQRSLDHASRVPGDKEAVGRYRTSNHRVGRQRSSKDGWGFDLYVPENLIIPNNPDTRHIIHSCTKSIVSALIGIAIDKGFIESTDQFILNFFSDKTVANLDSDKESITLEDLLTMSSGLECRDSYLYNWKGLNEMRASNDWVQHILDLPMANPPGSRFEYCNGGSYLLSAIVQQTTGMTALEFAKQNLFRPLGISDVDWPENRNGVNYGWGEMSLKPQDHGAGVAAILLRPSWRWS